MFIALEYFNFNKYRTFTYVKPFWILFIVLAPYKFLIIIIIIIKYYSAFVLHIRATGFLKFQLINQAILLLGFKPFYFLLLNQGCVKSGMCYFLSTWIDILWNVYLFFNCDYDCAMITSALVFINFDFSLCHVISPSFVFSNGYFYLYRSQASKFEIKM